MKGAGPARVADRLVGTGDVGGEARQQRQRARGREADEPCDDERAERNQVHVEALQSLASVYHDSVVVRVGAAIGGQP